MGRTPANSHTVPNHVAPGFASVDIQILADILDDVERIRIANENRVRQHTRDVPDADGGLRGGMVPMDDRSIQGLTTLIDIIADAEHQAELMMKRAIRRHVLGSWIRTTVGIGEKQGARLLAAIGDPYWNDLYDRPRTVSELWAYCGYSVIKLPATDHCSSETQCGLVGGGGTASDPGHDVRETQRHTAGVAQFRAKGTKVNWSPAARMRAHLVAESCIKQSHSPYRVVYDAGRAKYADAIHMTPCRRCGPAGNPAATGTPLSAGHQHARALRLVAKEILRDLWVQARDIHAGTKQTT